MNFNFIKIYQIDLFEQVNLTLSTQQLQNQYNLSHREIRQIQSGTFMILPKPHQILVSLNKIPIIVMPNYLLILQLNDDCTMFTSQFSQLMDEIQQSQQIWELAVFETLLLYLNKMMNEQYLQILVQFNSFRYQDHTNLNYILQKVKSTCQKVENLIEDVLENEQLLVQLVFINQKNDPSQPSSSQSISDNLSQFSKLSHTPSKSKLTPTPLNQYTQDELSKLPVSSETLIDIIDSYKIQFHSIFVESCEMDMKVDLKILQTQIQLNIQRNYIVNFSLNQKIINVALTASSIVGGIFGMNLLNPWTFDRSETTNSPVPFILSVIGTITVLVSFLVFLNYFSLPSRNKFADKVERKTIFRKGYRKID